uniref:ZMYM2-like/QRICH1 C-terminal domain-containing protein n=1 Tax=Tetranychus urticae TaxID=32264 RepID=T1JUA8_TETUR
MSERFGHQYDDDAVRDFIRCAIPKNTLKHDEWAKKMWLDWRSSRKSDPESESPPECIYGMKKKDEVDKWVTRFILEVRNANGEEYNPTSLKCLAAAIQRILRSNGYDGPGLMTNGSPVCVALNAKLKHLKSNGIGLEVKRADTINEVDERKLWDKKILDMETSKGLLNCVFFYNGKVLALRGRSEHYNLKIEQFIFKVDSNGTKFVEFWPMIRKNDQGIIKHSKIRKESIKQFDTNNDNSYYKILDKYISCLPVSNGPFYHRPIKEKAGPCYSLQILGINTIGGLLKNMFDDAEINDGRRITNHGLRATSTTTLFEAGFSQRTISL